jgi:hypothetical protein
MNDESIEDELITQNNNQGIDDEIITRNNNDIEIIIHKSSDKIYPEFIQNNDQFMVVHSKNIIKSIILTVFIVFTFPIIFCDIYYSIKYKVCLSYGIYEYLLSNGISNLIMLYPIILHNIYINEDYIDKHVYISIIYIIFEFICKLFIFIWTLLCITNYFNNINNIKCPNDISYYLYISSLIKIIYMIIYLFTLMISRNKINI